MNVEGLLKGCRYVGYPEDVLMAKDGTVLAEFSAGRTINDREIKDAVGNAIAEAVNGFTDEVDIKNIVLPPPDGHLDLQKRRGRPPKVK